MKIVGRRRQPPITYRASAQLLATGARFNEEIHRLPGGQSTFIPKGVYRFATHEQANRHLENCVAQGLAQTALGRSSWKNSAGRPRSKT